MSKEIILSDATETIQEDWKPKEGQWYWVDGQLACAVYNGSNFTRFHIAENGSELRVHFDELEGTVKPAPDGLAHIQEKIAGARAETLQLMQEVRSVTARLSIGSTPALDQGAQSQALAVFGGDAKVDAYKTELVKARDKELPELFENLKSSNRRLMHWMQAEAAPLMASVESQTTLLDAVKQRIFSVELYAGLSEQLHVIREGEPAAITEKIHIFQGRCYMDEECLAQYKTGGMDYETIDKFDAWLLQPENFERLFPFPKTVVAFRVRRHHKDYGCSSWSDFVKVLFADRMNKMTFLYIRNGTSLYCLRTAIDFDDPLFPDVQEGLIEGKMWGRVYSGRVSELISDHEYQEGLKNARELDHQYPKFFREKSYRNEYEPFDKSSVHYDDMLRHVHNQMQKHNRLVLVLQGLLDRSPVFHPHPPWQLWAEDGFTQALELIFNVTRALVPAHKPSFEAYKKKLNDLIVPGSVTYGQRAEWNEEVNGEHRGERDRRYWYKGPGVIHPVSRIKKDGTLVYTWVDFNYQSERTHERSFEIQPTSVFNLSAYTPGDFKQFFADPRTRADYLRWAKEMLTAEEYKAGNLKPDVQRPHFKKPPDPDRQYDYRVRKRRQELVGKTLPLAREIRLKGGGSYPAGALFKIVGLENGAYRCSRVDENGKFLSEYLTGVQRSDFKL